MYFAYNRYMTTNVQIRIDTKLKNEAEKTLNKLGLDLPTAFRIFLNKINITGGIPFPVVGCPANGSYGQSRDGEPVPQAVDVTDHRR